MSKYSENTARKIHKNITITDYQNRWLAEHRDVNLSGLVQIILDEMISSEAKQNQKKKYSEIIRNEREA